MTTKTIAKELRVHAPFTAFGTVTGVMIMAVMIQTRVPREMSASLFWTFHPLHVLLSAFVTAGMYRLHGPAGRLQTMLIGYAGSVGIATLSDSIIPFLGEILLDLPHRGIHLGLIEKWWLVNPLAILGIALAWFRPATKFPHAGHVLLSTWASLFHMTMAMGGQPDAVMLVLIVGFLFLAVWIPCCTSDIVFPLLFARG
ncbi:MAG: hypothetical protein EHM23_32700 [Acidobacteria bacterium]|nr:MAG: hypothetical protein EHM23_32700 [Acidobacteriota bacterium]